MSSPTISFAFVTHDHQPVGNLDWVMEEAYRLAYLPFLEVVERHPAVRVGVHYTGNLFEWLDAQHPDFLDRLRALIERGQVELLTGAGYEPILPIIPPRDAIGQTRMLTGDLKQRLGVRPKGFWLAERVWEPHLPEVLARSGVEYTLLDQAAFATTGLSEQELLGCFLTEHLGATVTVFPINQFLRRSIPFDPPEKAIGYLHAMASESGDRLAVWADDGEKLGSWPGTHKWVYEQGWLEQFFGLLEQNANWIRSTTLSEWLADHPPNRTVYLPCSSYPEMLEWAGGNWRNFLARYRESAVMHRRMLWVSRQVAEVEDDLAEERRVAGQPQADWPSSAQRELYRGQCNCPYWHGVFGGLYLPHLRAANWQHLLRAEAAAQAIYRPSPSLDSADFDGDGEKKYMFSTPTLGVGFDPAYGGAVFEFDYLALPWNLLATLSRRREVYHAELEQAGTPVPVDWYPRLSLLDHFLREDTTPESFGDCRYGEQGDFVNGHYALEPAPEFAFNPTRLTLSRDGNVWAGPVFAPIRVSKTLTPDDKVCRLEASYCMENTGDLAVELWFGCEINFLLSGAEGGGRGYRVGGGKRVHALNERGQHVKVVKMVALDPWLGIEFRLQLEQPAELWTMPIETTSRSEAEIERVYQGTLWLPNWRIKLEAGEQWKNTLRLIVRPTTTS